MTRHFIASRDSQIVQFGLDAIEIFQKSSYSMPCWIYFYNLVRDNKVLLHKFNEQKGWNTAPCKKYWQHFSEHMYTNNYF